MSAVSGRSTIKEGGKIASTVRYTQDFNPFRVLLIKNHVFLKILNMERADIVLANIRNSDTDIRHRPRRDP